MKEQEPRAVSEHDPKRGDTRGSIVNMASLASYAAMPGSSAYVASKHAVLGLTKTAGEFVRGAVCDLAGFFSFFFFPFFHPLIHSFFHSVIYPFTASSVLYYLLSLLTDWPLSLGLMKALEYVRYSIRVNCLCPSFVDTPMVTRAFQEIPGARREIEKDNPMGRMAWPEEIADVAVFLSSSRSSYVTGVGWVIAGGKGLTGS